MQYIFKSLISKNEIARIPYKKTFSYILCRTFVAQWNLTENDVQEIKIPVPWGHIAGKWWGCKNTVPLLCVHGLEDNASTFDRLIPFLNISSLLAIDLPGHGHSTHLPSGKIYDFIDYVFVIRRIINHFKWKQYALFGHSFGSAICFVYASIYPKEIKYLMCFECIRSVLNLNTVNFTLNLNKGFEAVLGFEKKLEISSPPKYKLHDIIDLMIKRRLGSITSLESVLTLLKRGTCKLKENKVSSEKTSGNTNVKIYQDEATFFKECDSLQIMHLIFDKKLDHILKNMKYVLEKVKSAIPDNSEKHLYMFTSDPRVKEYSFGVLSNEFIIECSNHIICPVLTMRTEYGFTHGAGKYWGPSNRETILLLHGWQDNAGSFNALIPMLPSAYSYLAIDLPGHGLSSHFPKGIFYTLNDILLCIRRIQDYFDWKKISLISHSLGSIITFLYSAIFPHCVDFYVGIDAVKPMSRDVQKSHQKAANLIEKMLYYDSLSMENAVLYKKEELIQKMMKTMKLKRESSCKILMKRGTLQTEDGHFSLVRDPRIKGDMPFGFTHTENMQMASKISCSVLIIKSRDTTFFEPKKRVYDVLNVIKSGAKYYEYHSIPGSHHLHLETPEVVAPMIEKFLKKVKC